MKIKEYLAHSDAKFQPFLALYQAVFLWFGPIYFIYYIYNYTISYEIWIITIILTLMTQISVTAGYHRYFTHKSYNAHPILEIIYLFFGAISGQDSAIRWAYFHRKHHMDTDGYNDIYNGKLGIIWNQFLWIAFCKWDNRLDMSEESLIKQYPVCKDLIKNKYTRIQHQWWFFIFMLWIAIISLIDIYFHYNGQLIVTLIFFRIAYPIITSNLANSFGHKYGKRHKDIGNRSARNNLIVAIFSLGEGYHSNHHAKESDYRAGYKKYDFDPNKWLIYSLSKIGLTYDLKRPLDKS